MSTDCTAQRFLFQGPGRREIVAVFDGGRISSDALLAAVVGKSDPEGHARKRARDRGSALAGKSTLNRLEWGVASETAEDRYRRIAISPEAVDRFFVDVFLDAYDEPPEEIVLDLDATDDPLHGAQEGASFTPTKATTAICRSTSSAVGTCSVPG